LLQGSVNFGKNMQGFFELLFERVDQIEREVTAASRRCRELTQTVPGKAFRVELVGRVEDQDDRFCE
jgi:hypothetical protein